MSAQRIVFVEASVGGVLGGSLTGRIDRVFDIRHHVTAMEQVFDAILRPRSVASEVAQVASARS